MADGHIGLGGDLVPLLDVEHVDYEAVILGELLTGIAFQDAAAPLRQGHAIRLSTNAIREGGGVSMEEPHDVIVVGRLSDGQGRGEHAGGLEGGSSVEGSGGGRGSDVWVEL